VCGCEGGGPVVVGDDGENSCSRSVRRCAQLPAGYRDIGAQIQHIHAVAAKGGGEGEGTELVAASWR
jgi:hypothetical protein